MGEILICMGCGRAVCVAVSKNGKPPKKCPTYCPGKQQNQPTKMEDL